MCTEKQLRANRANAQKSTGPRSAEGKKRSAQNAVKHGLRSQLPVIPGEDPTELKALHDSLIESVAPHDTIETLLTDRLADAEWRQRRFLRYESALYYYNASTANTPADHLITLPPESKAEAQLLLDGAAIARMAGGTDSMKSLARYDASATRNFFQTFRALSSYCLQDPFSREDKPPASAQKAALPNEPISGLIPKKPTTSEIQFDPIRAHVPAATPESILLPAKGGPHDPDNATKTLQSRLPRP